MNARRKARRSSATKRTGAYVAEDRIRLAFISWQLEEKKPLSDAHQQWLHEILVEILSGVDLRPRFVEPKKGRPGDRDTVHAAIDYRLRLARNADARREDVAWEVAQDWGYEDGDTVLKYERRARALCDTIIYNIGIEPSQEAVWLEILKHGSAAKRKGRKSP